MYSHTYVFLLAVWLCMCTTVLEGEFGSVVYLES